MSNITPSTPDIQAELPAVVMSVALAKAQKVLADWSAHRSYGSHFGTLCTLAEILDSETLAAAQHAVTEA